MADERPATIAELRKAFAQDPGFALECAEKALTLTEAKAAYADVLAERGTAPLGNAPLSCRRDNSAAASGASDAGDPVEAFHEAVAEQMQRPGFQDRKKAIAAVCRRDVDLHEAYVLSCNEGAGVDVLQRIRSKFDAIRAQRRR